MSNLKEEKLNLTNRRSQSSDDIYFTEISNVNNVTSSSITLDITRPPVEGMPGGYLYVYDVSAYFSGGAFKFRQKVDGNTNIENVVLSVESGSRVDFLQGTYVIGYGPTWTDDNAVCIATTVKLSNGSPQLSKAALFTPISQSISEVNSYCDLPNGIFGVNSGSCRAILRTGSTIGQGTKLASVIEDDFSDGAIALENDMEFGEEYNVGIYLYSTYSFVAGYTFKL